MANKTSKKSAKIAKKAPAKRVAAKAAERPSRIVDANSASRLMDQRIRELGGWRGEILARMRTLILQAAPDIVEECKWIKPTNPFGVPVWSHAGIVCTGEAYAKVVKLTFARGATIPDPSRLFNSSLEGKTRRAIDIHEGEKVNARAFKALVKAAWPRMTCRRRSGRTSTPCRNLCTTPRSVPSPWSVERRSPTTNNNDEHRAGRSRLRAC
ncbi:MAG TPA: DUF1801 domain-containing protein [Acidimicrobiales bacterium]